MCVCFPCLWICLVIYQVITSEAPLASQERYCITASYSHHNNLSGVACGCHIIWYGPSPPSFRGESGRFSALIWLQEAAYASYAKASHQPSGRTQGLECVCTSLCVYIYTEVRGLGRYSKCNNDSKHWTWYICANEMKLTSAVMRWRHSIVLGLYCMANPIQTR